MFEGVQHILVIENDDHFRSLVVNAFEDWKTTYHLTVVASFEEARTLLVDKFPDYIVSEFAIGQETIFSVLPMSHNSSLVPVILLLNSTLNEKFYENTNKKKYVNYIPRNEMALGLLPLFVGFGLKEWYNSHELEQIRALLIDSEGKYSAMAQTAQEAIVSLNNKCEILSWNNAAEQMFGYQGEEIYGNELSFLFQQKCHAVLFSRFHRVVNEYDNGLSTIPFELDGQNKSGKGFPLEISFSRWKNGNQVYFIVRIKDISIRKRAEDELIRTQKMESVQILAGGIAHDFNNILTGIITNLFMAKTYITKNNSAYNLINEAEKALFKASRLTRQFLSFTQGGAQVLENTSLKLLIEESAGFALSGTNVDYELAIDDHLWNATIDRGMIDQVLNNLLINAVQAMVNGGTVMISAINIVVGDTASDATESCLPLKPGRYIKIGIKDQGPGIEKDTLRKIFDPYFTTKNGGSGLGLSIVYSIIQKHNGFITVSSDYGHGALFTFYLPASDAVVKNETENKGDGDMVSGAGKVLVMDDDRAVRKATEMLLEHIGYSVECVSSGEEAIMSYQSLLDVGERFSLVIMDLTIPGGMGAKETVKKLLAIDPGAKVIIASGYYNDPALIKCTEYGFSGALKKPFTLADFKKVINTVIGS